MAKARTSKILLKWHRRLGITSALFVLMLAITGILLNHGNQLGLDRAHLSATFAKFFYGIEAQIVFVNELDFATGSREIVIAGSEIYRADKKIHACSGEYIGAQAVQANWLLVCSGAVSVLTFDDEIIDIFDAQFDLQAPLRGIAACEGSVCVLAGEEVLKFDSNKLQFESISIDLQWRERTPASKQVQAQYDSKSTVITWERFVQDLHAGRFFGGIGPWLMDIVAVLFIILAISGLMIWMKKDLKSRRKRKRL